MPQLLLHIKTVNIIIKSNCPQKQEHFKLLAQQSFSYLQYSKRHSYPAIYCLQRYSSISEDNSNVLCGLMCGHIKATTNVMYTILHCGWCNIVYCIVFFFQSVVVE